MSKVMSTEAPRHWDAETLRIHRAATVMLGYMNPAAWYRPEGLDFSRFAEETGQQGSLPRLRRGGVDVIVLSHGVETEPTGVTPATLDRPAAARTQQPVFQSGEQVRHLLRSLDGIRRVLDANASEVGLALTVADAERLNREGRTAVFLHLTGAWIGGDLAALRAYHQLGVRAIHPAIEGLRGVADAASDLAEANGLTPLGKEIVREMNRLRMVVDVSHASDKSFWDILETSEQPVVASHSNSRLLCPIPRNLSDEQVKALAQKGGVVGVHFASNFINFAFHQARRASGSMEAFAARLKELHRQYPDPYAFLARRYDPATWQDIPPPYGTREKGPELPRATVAQLCEHLDRLVEVAGIDHVGIGSDYDLGDIVHGLHRADLLPNLTAELLRRGYAETDIRKLWGLNFLRVFRKILG